MLGFLHSNKSPDFHVKENNLWLKCTSTCMYLPFLWWQTNSDLLKRKLGRFPNTGDAADKTNKTEKYAAFFAAILRVLLKGFIIPVTDIFIRFSFLFTMKNTMWQNVKNNNINCTMDCAEKLICNGMRQMFSRLGKKLYQNILVVVGMWLLVTNNMSNWQKYVFHKCPLKIFSHFYGIFFCRSQNEE